MHLLNADLHCHSDVSDGTLTPEALAERAKRNEITQDEVINDLRELRDICMGRKTITVTEVIKNAQAGTAEPVEVNVSAFEPTAANKALELLGKHIGMFKDKVEVSGPAGGPIQVSVNFVAAAPKQDDDSAKH